MASETVQLENYVIKITRYTVTPAATFEVKPSPPKTQPPFDLS